MRQVSPFFCSYTTAVNIQKMAIMRLNYDGEISKRTDAKKKMKVKRNKISMFLLHRGRFVFSFKFYDAFVKTTTRNDIESTKREGLIVGFIINLTVKSPFTLVGR